MSKLYDECVNIYEKFGQSGVFDYINREHPEVSWKVCHGCESESPTDEGFCLVCGQVITEYAEDREPCYRAVKLLESAVSHFVGKNQSHVPLSVLNDILDQLVYTDDETYNADEEED